jgi:hypothetical protein
MKPETLEESRAATRLRISSSWRSGRVIVILVVAILYTTPPGPDGQAMAEVTPASVSQNSGNETDAASAS